MAVHWGGRGPGHTSRKTVIGGAGDPFGSSVVLLSGFEGTDGSTTLIDESPVGRTLTAQSTAQIDTAQFKYGSSSLLLNGTSDYVTAPDSNDFEFGAGAFTIEMFARFTSAANDIAICGNYDSGSNGWQFGRQGGALKLLATGAAVGDAAWGPTLNQWYHFAVSCEASGSCRLFIDGGLHKKVARTGAVPATTEPFTIGRIAYIGLWWMAGHLDELRITKGVSRYNDDGGFTVPTSAYPRG